MTDRVTKNEIQLLLFLRATTVQSVS